MEENYAFDAEVYADETEFKDAVDFREDQRSRSFVHLLALLT
jgi:hypothetical protein